MLTITVIATGKLKEEYLKSAAVEYIKRLKVYANINIVELAEYKLCENPNEVEIEKALEIEAVNILAKIPPKALIIPLCIEGEQLSSIQLATKISNKALEGISQIVFIIGSSHGLHSSIKKLGKPLSVSKMTFPHQLFRIMLLEQIYRSISIINNTKYHK